MKLYHASTVQIDKFYVPYGGIHVGGIHSALEASLRKIRAYNGIDDIYIHLHVLEVDTGRSEMHHDEGDCASWRKLINTYKDTDVGSVEYKNKYEPDVCNSFMLWEPERIIILETIKYIQDEAEDILNAFYEKNGI